MNLYIVKYLLLLIHEGEKTNKELALTIGDSVSNASHALNILHRLEMVRHPMGRKSWTPDTTKPLILTLEKLFLVSKDSPEVKRFLSLPSGIYVGAEFHKEKREITMLSLLNLTGLSRMSITKTLKEMEKQNLIRKKISKPNQYYPVNTMLSKIFFKSCKEIIELFSKKDDKKILAPDEIIDHIKNEESVLVLVHYGSSAGGKIDIHSDIDLFVITRDKISRGEILSRYSHKKIDLSIYSKSGFLELVRHQPDFVTNLARARVLKGGDILKAVIQ